MLQVLHPDSAATNAAISEVASLYQTRFRQEAVLRTRNASCFSLGRISD